MKINDIVYVILNGARVARVQILKISGNLYTIKMLELDKVIRLPKHRLYETKEEAQKELQEQESVDIMTNEGVRPPRLH